ncbi:hypothetical protein [Streptococcus sanguinis]|jgi:hypothetical protein|uniref:Uncharacterized protein n=1 Tax=Streptococcus sanguinis SK355 TaxID=888816 RepID=F3UNP5_STRSA|nr:hypothetical protein [Streptococcus sanguinis]EGJ43231.1 hypothetical protein HMPREF9389_0453 [Streptococcus sanguinis SK355]
MVKMVLGSSDKQGSTMSSVAQARVTAYNQAISALTISMVRVNLQVQPMIQGKTME